VSVNGSWIRLISGFTFQRPVVTSCVTGFNIQQFHVLPTHYIYVFCMDLRTNSEAFPTYLLAFVTKTECVYCAVRTGSLSTIQVIHCVEIVKL